MRFKRMSRKKSFGMKSKRRSYRRSYRSSYRSSYRRPRYVYTPYHRRYYYAPTPMTDKEIKVLLAVFGLATLLFFGILAFTPSNPHYGTSPRYVNPEKTVRIGSSTETLRVQGFIIKPSGKKYHSWSIFENIILEKRNGNLYIRANDVIGPIYTLSGSINYEPSSEDPFKTKFGKYEVPYCYVNTFDVSKIVNFISR